MIKLKEILSNQKTKKMVIKDLQKIVDDGDVTYRIFLHLSNNGWTTNDFHREFVVGSEGKVNHAFINTIFNHFRDNDLRLLPRKNQYGVVAKDLKM